MTMMNDIINDAYERRTCFIITSNMTEWSMMYRWCATDVFDIWCLMSLHASYHIAYKDERRKMNVCSVTQLEHTL